MRDYFFNFDHDAKIRIRDGTEEKDLQLVSFRFYDVIENGVRVIKCQYSDSTGKKWDQNYLAINLIKQYETEVSKEPIQPYLQGRRQKQ